MFEQGDKELREWVETLGLVAKKEIAFTPPGEEGTLISLYLFQVLRTLKARQHELNGGDAATITLHYLITTRHDDPIEAHRLLGELMVAALETSAYEVETEPLPLSAWSAFGQMPQPAFILKVPLTRERPERTPQRVQQPLRLRSTTIGSLHGVVLGPNDVPIHGAAVEIPALRLHQRTDANGAFAFAAIATDGEGQPLRLQIRAKGQLFEQVVEQPPGSSAPVVIRVVF